MSTSNPLEGPYVVSHLRIGPGGVPDARPRVTFPLPLSEGKLAFLQVPWPMTLQEIDMLAWQMDHELQTIERINRPRWEAEKRAKQLATAQSPDLPPAGAD